MTRWQQRQVAHAADCDLCQRQLASPHPFHKDLCHMNIHPDGGRWDDPPVVQCPHLRWLSADLCERHLAGAVASYRRMVERTAPLN